MARAVEPHKDAVEVYGPGLAALPAGVSPVIPPWAWYRIALGTSRATEEGGGEKEEDARRTFEAGPERPLAVIDDGLPLGPWYLSAVHPLAAWQAGQAGGEESKDQACRGLPSCIP